MGFGRWRWVFSSSRLTQFAELGSSAVRTTFHALFSLFFPDDCRICGDALHEATRIPVCARCLKKPEPLSAEFFCARCRTPFQNGFPLDSEGRCAICRSGLRGFDAAYCFGLYEGALRKLIHQFKYSCIRPLARPLGGMLSDALPRDERFDAIVPVPLHWRRQWGRTFNQSALLAEDLARRTGLPVVGALRRVRSTAPQAGLTNAARRRNVAGVFRCVRRNAVHGKCVLLVDDVMTTGSTGAACAMVLKRAGAKRVALLTLARVDRRIDRPVEAPQYSARGAS